MTATDELRRLLDERGVEYVAAEDGHTQHTWWSDGDHEIGASNSGKRLAVYNLTPAQAIAATLGAGTCHAIISDNLTESEGMGDAWADCSECGHLLFVLTDLNSEPPNFCPNCGRRVVEVAQ